MKISLMLFCPLWFRMTRKCNNNPLQPVKIQPLCTGKRQCFG